MHLLPSSCLITPGGGRDEDLREDGPRAERVAQDQDGQVRRSAQRGRDTSRPDDAFIETEFMFGLNLRTLC